MTNDKTCVEIATTATAEDRIKTTSANLSVSSTANLYSHKSPAQRKLVIKMFRKQAGIFPADFTGKSFRVKKWINTMSQKLSLLCTTH